MYAECEYDLSRAEFEAYNHILVGALYLKHRHMLYLYKAFTIHQTRTTCKQTLSD